MRPRSPYGVAKLAAHGLVGTLREHHGLFACSGITYNHESPRRPPHFVTRKITRGAAAIARGRQEELVLGDLGAVRDWSHAEDVMRAAILAVRADAPGDYVIASAWAAPWGTSSPPPSPTPAPTRRAACASTPRSCARPSPRS